MSYICTVFHEHNDSVGAFGVFVYGSSTESSAQLFVGLVSPIFGPGAADPGTFTSTLRSIIASAYHVSSRRPFVDILTSVFVGLKNPNWFRTEIDVRSTLATECHLAMLMHENQTTEHHS